MLNYQFNKTALGELGKQLKMRQRALPTIKSKESALRLEVKKAKDNAHAKDKELALLMSQYDYMVELWGEIDTKFISVVDVELSPTKIAGVVIPTLKEVIYDQMPYNRFTAPLWIADGVKILKSLAQIGIEREVYYKKQELLEFSRKKTTQKVNLYEKVQIPGYEQAILKIKRFLEDEENISKSSQKIIKSRIENAAQ